MRANVDIVVHEGEMRTLGAQNAVVTRVVEALLRLQRVSQPNRQLAAEILHSLRRVVAAVVVYDQYLPIEMLDALLCGEGAKTRWQIPAAVVRADDDRKIHFVP